MFGAMFGAAMFGDGDEDDINEFFMGKFAMDKSNFITRQSDKRLAFQGWDQGGRECSSTLRI
jgi:hypothetical protein